MVIVIVAAVIWLKKRHKRRLEKKRDLDVFTVDLEHQLMDMELQASAPKQKQTFLRKDAIIR